jgi:hypothetical protein
MKITLLNAFEDAKTDNIELGNLKLLREFYFIPKEPTALLVRKRQCGWG